MGMLGGFRVVTAAVAPTPGGMEWGHSWRPIWSFITEQLEQFEQTIGISDFLQPFWSF